MGFLSGEMSQLLRYQAVLEAKAMQAGEEWGGTPKLGGKDGLQTAPRSLTTCLYKQYDQMKPAVLGTREGHQSHSSGHHRTLFRNVCGSLDGPKASLSRLWENRSSIKGNEPPGDGTVGSIDVLSPL